MCRKQTGLIVLMLILVLATGAWAEIHPGQKMGIDFGPTTTENWNNITANGPIADGSVIDLNGDVLTGLSIIVVDGRFFNNDGANDWVGLAAQGGSAPAEFVDSVTTDIGGNWGWGRPFLVTVAGLNDSLLYDIAAVCTSIPPYVNEETLTINNGVSQSLTRSDTRDNGTYHSFTGMSTDGNGNLELAFTNVPQNNPIVSGILITATAVARASGPQPDIEAEDVPRDTTLAWTPGLYAVAHDVYFGTDFNDVNDATRDHPLNVLVSQDLDVNTFDPGRLSFGQIHYWRVDEVNGLPDNTVFKGDIWSFTTEPYSIPIEWVTATASSAHTADMGPEKTIDGSGLDDADQHNTDGTNMWLTSSTDTDHWIQYEFVNPQKLDKMWVWNSNQNIESLIGFGAKNVTIETSMDGTTWSALADVPEFAQATGSLDYTYNTVVDFGGVVAQYVKLTVHSGWGVMPQYGLSEVRFFVIPVYPREPLPAVEAIVDSVEVTLQWRAGREADIHEIILSSNLGAVEDDSAVIGTAQENTFTPDPLNYSTTYYWKIQEVNEIETPARYEGDVWNFTTPECAVIDDFEMYADEAFLEIWAFWADGYEDPSNGAIVGNGNIGERTVVHEGNQSMPIQYNNSNTATSEVTLQIGGRDWTASGIKSLSLYFHGTAGNTGQLYIRINDARIDYNGDAGDIAGSVWQPWIIDLSTVDGGLQNVTTLTIGIAEAGASGRLFIDDIRLYPLVPEYVTPTAPDVGRLVAYYALNGDATDGSGNGAHGVENGFPSFEAGVEGLAIQLNGIDDFVELGVPKHWPSGTAPRTLCAWAKTFSVEPGWRVVAGYGSPSGAQATGLVMNGTSFYASGYGSDISIGSFWDTEEWHHVGLTYDGTVLRLYADGIVAAFAERAWNTVITVARIGRQVNEASEFWDGLVDEVRLYDQVLSQAEMAWLAGKTAPVAKPF